MVQAALDRAAEENPHIYKPRDPKDISHHKHIYDAGVSYPEEFDGNEPMDYSNKQQPLEPADVPRHSILPGMNAMDESNMSTVLSSSSATVDHVRRSSSSIRTQKNTHSSSKKHRHRNPQETLRELEQLAETNANEAIERLHALKIMPASA